MLIPTIRKAFKVLECQFQPFERDSKHSNANSNHSNGIQSTWMQIPTIRTEFEGFESQFQPFRTAFEAIECQFQPFQYHSKHSNANSNHLNGIGSTGMQSPSDLKQSNANSNHSYGIRSIRMPIPNILMAFEALECQFQLFKRHSKH